ncbi:MAG: hypothetical protein NVSMB57_09670 [Actinomycetota bacterium]
MNRPTTLLLLTVCAAAFAWSPATAASAATCQPAPTNEFGTITACVDPHAGTTTIAPEASVVQCYGRTCTTLAYSRVPLTGISYASGPSTSLRPGTVGPIPNLCIGTMVCSPRYAPVFGLTAREAGNIVTLMTLGVPLSVVSPTQVCVSTAEECYGDPGAGFGGYIRIRKD